MLCQECQFEITAQMTHAVRQNNCPACGAKIMSAEKMQQYRQLRQVLTQHQLTNNPVVEAKLREKIIALVLQHFELTLVQTVEMDPDLIDLDGDASPVTETQEETNRDNKSSGVQSTPKRIARGGQGVRDQKHSSLVTDKGASLDRLRREVFEDTYGEVGEDVALQDVELVEGEDISMEEAKQFFPGHEKEVGVEMVNNEVLDQEQEVEPTEGRIRRVRS